jgi:T5orf172 domain.
MSTQSVYFIQAGDDELYKIGFAKNPEQRLKNLQTGSPTPLQLVHHIETDYATELESHLHAALADYRSEPGPMPV